MIVFYHVARNTFRECLREPIYYVLLVTAVFLIGLFPSLALFVFYEQIKLVVDSSMATTLVFGLLAAVLCASNTISRETRDGTMLMLLSKPVPRWMFVVAKIVGVLAALTVFVLICNIACLIALRVAVDQFRLDFLTLYIYYGLMALAGVFGAWRNYFSRKLFASSAVMAMLVLFLLQALQIQFLPYGDSSYGELTRLKLEVIPALTLLFFAVWTMGAITVVLATRLDMVPTLIIGSAIFFLGLVSDYLVGRYAPGSMSFKLLYAIIPNWQFFWLADALASQRAIPISYILLAFAYVLMYITICAVIASRLFRDREIGGYGK